MRDDLHKGAPVPSDWKNLIRAANRDADWPVNGIRAAEKAVQSLINEFSQPLLKEVEELLVGRQLWLDPSLGVERFLQQHQASPLLSAFIDDLKISLREPGSQLTAESIAEMVASVVREFSERFVRAATLHVDRRAPEDTKEINRRMRTLLSQVNFQERAALAVKGIHSQRISANPAFDPDEALPLGGRNA